MKVIWKHELSLQPEKPLTVELPNGAQLLHVGAQNHIANAICLWEMHTVRAEETWIQRTFEIHGTGHDFDPAGKVYIGTAVQASGFVWHLFEIVP